MSKLGARAVRTSDRLELVYLEVAHARSSPNGATNAEEEQPHGNR
jgi:hypothetical protein